MEKVNQIFSMARIGHYVFHKICCKPDTIGFKAKEKTDPAMRVGRLNVLG